MIIKYGPKAQLTHQLHNFYPNTGWEYLIDEVYPNVMNRIDACASPM